MKLRCLKFKLVALLLVLLLVGCGGGGRDSPAVNDIPIPKTIVVVPSLGKITGATVNVYQADNSTLLISGELESSGKVALIFENYTGPVVIEVVGNNNAQYFDEASNAFLAFGADKKMRAIVPSEIDAYAVTMLTELAYQKALSTNAFPLQAADVNALNESIRKATIPEITNILTPPVLFDENTISNSLGDDDEGKYALKLAALVKLGEGDATPALLIMEALSKDFDDGSIDGKDASDSSFVAPYSDFKTELEAKLIEAANSLGNDDLKLAVESYPSIEINIDDPTQENDTTPPTVTSVSPVDEATGVSVNATITATFSEAIKPETINESNFTVSGATGTVSYNTTNNTATFTPSTPLVPNTTYTATIISNVQDLAGNALAVKEWSFVTEAESVVATKWRIYSFGGHQIGIKSDGSLWARGANESGQLGDGTTIKKETLIQIGTDTTWISAIAGFKHTVAIKSDGSLWAWGDNGFGQLGDGTLDDKLVPTQIGASNEWSSVSAYNSTTFAIKRDGTLWAWGSNGFGQLGDGTQISKSTPNQIGEDNNWNSVLSGRSSTYAIKNDGTLWAWGDNESGQLGDGTHVDKTVPTQVGLDNDWALVSTATYLFSYTHTLAIKTNGTLWAWGDNSSYQLGDGTTNDKLVPTQVGTASDWASVAAGGLKNSFATKTDGTLWAWGLNHFGSLGNGSRDNQTPTQRETESANTWTRILMAGLNFIALKSDNTLWKGGRE